MLVGGIISIIVLAVLGWLLWLFVELPADGDDEHADPDNFGI